MNQTLGIKIKYLISGASLDKFFLTIGHLKELFLIITNQNCLKMVFKILELSLVEFENLNQHQPMKC